MSQQQKSQQKPTSTYVVPPAVEPQCGNCKFFRERFNNETGGECRRYPPAFRNQDIQFVGVDEGMWCGEWKSR
jgi:hypothetical protein